MNNAPFPKELCQAQAIYVKDADGKLVQLPIKPSQYGFYRKLNDGKMEFMSFCKADATNWLAIHKDDLNRMLDEYLPKPTDAQ